MGVVWRRAAKLLAGILVAGGCATAAPAADLQVRNLGWEFVSFMERTEKLPLDQRVAAFKRQVGAQFPAFYEPKGDDPEKAQARFDKAIANAIERFPTIREAYIGQLTMFDSRLSGYLSSFHRTFPDFAPTSEIYLLHSLGQMDGGTRNYDGQRYLIFGADVMARVHQNFRSEAPFFHHELFHVLHEPALGPCDELWCALWTEGLAVHVAATLNPGSSDDELLLSFPDNSAAQTRKRLTEAWSDLRAKLDSTDEGIYGELFSSSRHSGDLPLRRGYYLGYLVAQEVARTHDLQTLARLPAADVKPLVRQAVEALATQTH